MKRFQFRLERLLRLKHHVKHRAEQRQRQARGVFDRAAAEVADLENRIVEAGSGGLPALREAIALGAWQARYDTVAALGHFLTEARAEVDKARRKLEEADRERAAIAAEVEALEHLRQKQWQAHHEELACRTQEQLDEVGMRRWMAARVATNGPGSHGGEEPPGGMR